MNKVAFVPCIIALVCGTTFVCGANGPYEPTWSSLARHTAAPEWFRDAKFGIYFHWGVYSVPAFDNEWYPRNMHILGHGAHQHHLAKYGEPTEYPYHKFIPQFTAEHFNADAWAALFRKAGAKFAGPVAEHHDGFAMWATQWSPWNAAAMGPKRDITGELEKAIKKQGLKFITTFHHARHWNGHKTKGSQRFYQFLKKNYPALLEDDKNKLLYGEMPWEDFQAMWYGKLVEVIDRYHPDLMWFDTGLDLMPEPLIRQYLAYYFNHAAKTGQQVAVFYKHNDLPTSVGVLDYERGRAHDIAELPWLTDDSITIRGWCYTQRDNNLRSPREVLHTLIDLVSKNGQLLFNIAPKADGSIPQQQIDTLLGVGRWLDRYGAAIYATRPYTVYGEGPSRFDKQNHAGNFNDIRFTRSKDGRTLYAILLGWPDARTITIRSLKDAADLDLDTLAVLGSEGPVRGAMTDAGLRVTLPEQAPPLAELATVITVRFK